MMDEKEAATFAEKFYSRQTLLNELGMAGQEKLARARVAVVGVGGLGSVSSLYIVLAGVGYVRLIDHDTVETYNLHRQILYSPEDLHQPKAKVAAKRLRQHNSLVHVEAVCERLTEDNALRLLDGVDVVVDGLDNRLSRYIVNRACMKLRLPYVFGAAIGLEGNVSVFNPPRTGCLECLLPEKSGLDPPCSRFGILGATAGIIGSLQAMEAIKLLAGFGESLMGKLLICDFRDMDFSIVPIVENPNCPVCH